MESASSLRGLSDFAASIVIALTSLGFGDVGGNADEACIQLLPMREGTADRDTSSLSPSVFACCLDMTADDSALVAWSRAAAGHHPAEAQPPWSCWVHRLLLPMLAKTLLAVSSPNPTTSSLAGLKGAFRGDTEFERLF